MFLTADNLQALWLTFQVAALTTLILLLLGTPLAWWLARRPSWWKEVVAAVCALPIVLPPTVIGFYLLIALGLQQGKWELVPLLVLVIVFQMLTTPAASIVLARAGYRSRHYDGVDLALDELRDDVQRAERATGVEEERAALAAREADSDNSDHAG